MNITENDGEVIWRFDISVELLLYRQPSIFRTTFMKIYN